MIGRLLTGFICLLGVATPGNAQLETRMAQAAELWQQAGNAHSRSPACVRPVADLWRWPAPSPLWPCRAAAM